MVSRTNALQFLSEKQDADESLIGLTNGGIRVKRADNVILRNLYLHVAPSKKDLVELQYSTNVWIDHNDFSSVGITGNKDTYDGLLDITHVRKTSFCLTWTTLHQANTGTGFRPGHRFMEQVPRPLESK